MTTLGIAQMCDRPLPVRHSRRIECGAVGGNTCPCAGMLNMLHGEHGLAVLVVDEPSR